MAAVLERPRLINLAGFIICAVLIAAAFYMELALGMEPCPLCMFQRIGVYALGAVFLIAALHGARAWGARVYGVLLLLVAALGGAVSVRHLYLQSLPAEEVPACGPGLDYLMDVFPLFEAIRVVFEGSGECAEVHTILGLSIPAWTLMAFIGLGLAGFIYNWLVAERR
ncbi:disulfide bond formation protein B [Alkalilimnicola sp. S0819]|uniref:disulfide bond formation protein B n=1 Tax=Alkalilimnicola sp. S0819 TaxID=2613922 RepID=UPI0012628F43|nr:disulfide bond formation protein B [Alkalilimnicola sp. S0819]KAB7623620.1 disulfide bond formation protein B [Alkalilimnicola sp. S0819]MPQ16744.1 disulfide bond formation protein B [Alkalilimnicola sp. S0819]